MSKSSGSFAFRQFELIQGNHAWKVGTDSVLLGCWCRIDGASRGLDMGTGSGILSLMLAQRDEHIQIDAIELMEEAFAEANVNIARSRWADRIRVIKGDLMNANTMAPAQYDLIVCNPPYYPSGPISPSAHRQSSRQGQGFSLMDVPGLAKISLRKDGRLNVVIPFGVIYMFIEQANRNGLFVHRKLDIKHTDDSVVSLVLLELSHRIVKPDQQTLILYNTKTPTQEYRRLCEKFYCDMSLRNS